MSDFVTRVLTLIKALPTWLTAAAAVIAIFSEEIVDLLPESWQGGFSQGVLVVLAILAAAVNIVRRVTPVVSAERGLHPPAA